MRPALLTLLTAALSLAQSLSGDALVQALQKGGYVIAMRHTSSPNAVPAGATERQLDAEGRAAATAMGAALRALKIPVTEVLSSPTQRAMDTARAAQWPAPVATPELGDNGQSMSGGTPAQAAWLKNRVTQSPKTGNVILITHMPNLREAFPQATNVADGEALIFSPQGTLVARVKSDEWKTLQH